MLGTEMGTNISGVHIISVFFHEDGGGVYVQVYGYWNTTQCPNSEEWNMNLQRYEDFRIQIGDMSMRFPQCRVLKLLSSRRWLRVI
jgi:hypothetical protein